MFKPSFALTALCCAPLAACSTSTNDVLVTVAPEVISSLDGTAAVHAIVLADREPVINKPVEATVSYTDRNGTVHSIAPIDGTTDKTGAFDATLTGLSWDGTGTVTVTVTGVSLKGMPLAGDTTFAVLDRTPPKATIIAPANNAVRVNMDTTVQVHVTDEIGVSQVWFETGGADTRDRGTIIASGTTDATVDFTVTIPDTTPVGSMVTLYALAADLSGNQGAAQPVTVTVAP